MDNPTIQKTIAAKELTVVNETYLSKHEINITELFTLKKSAIVIMECTLWVARKLQKQN